MALFFCDELRYLKPYLSVYLYGILIVVHLHVPFGRRDGLLSMKEDDEDTNRATSSKIKRQGGCIMLIGRSRAGILSVVL